eukprot:gene1032-3893_t
MQDSSQPKTLMRMGQLFADLEDALNWHYKEIGSVPALNPLGDVELFTDLEDARDWHYKEIGFVPALNPHEDVELFADLEDALDWHYKEFGSSTMSEAKAKPIYERALEAGMREKRRATQVGPNGDSNSKSAVPPPVAQQVNSIKSIAGVKVDIPLMDAFMEASVSMAGGKVDIALMAAFMEASVVPAGADDAGTDSPAEVKGRMAEVNESQRMAEIAVARRCWQLLGGMPTPLTVDAAALWGDAATVGNFDAAPNLGQLRQGPQAVADVAALPHGVYSECGWVDALWGDVATVGNFDNAPKLSLML